MPVCLVANVPERSGSLGLAAIGNIRRPLGREYSVRAHVAVVVYYTPATTTAPPRFRSAGPSRLPQQLGNCTSGA